MLGNIVKAHVCLQHSTHYIQDAQHITLHIANILKYRGGKSQTPNFLVLDVVDGRPQPALSSDRVFSGSWPVILLWLWFTRTACTRPLGRALAPCCGTREPLPQTCNSLPLLVSRRDNKLNLLESLPRMICTIFRVWSPGAVSSHGRSGDTHLPQHFPNPPALCGC